VRTGVPWWAKIFLKVIWSRLPIPYGLWKQIGIFRHGFMERPDYVSSVFMRHWNRAVFARKTDGFTAMELGCGDSLASCLMGRSVGAARYYLVDAGRFASQEIDTYKRIASALTKQSATIPDISHCRSVEEMLTSVDAQYLTHGLESLRQIPDRTLDFVWSQAVFEHIGRGEFVETMAQLRRIIREDGVLSHRVDLKDHLQGGLNNLRFSHSSWESPLMTKSGFYTNRIRYQEMLRIIQEAGFAVEVVHADRWTFLPTRREVMAPEFRSLDIDDLLVSGFDIVMRPV